MGERYWITGVQLGLLKAVPFASDRNKVIDKILDNQFIVNCIEEQDKKEFEEILKNIPIEIGIKAELREALKKQKQTKRKALK